MMKNKTTKERNWDNPIDLCAKTHEGRDEPPMLRTLALWRVHQCPVWEAGMPAQTPVSLHHTRAKHRARSYSQPAPLLTSLHPELLAAKGCSRHRHRRVSWQSKQTEQKLISPPEISQQIKLNFPDGKAWQW